MYYNYLKIAFRNLFRQLSYTLINVVGLGTGIAAFLLIMLYIQYHLSFDEHIPEAENLYRVTQIQQAEGVGEQHVAFNPGPLADEAVKQIPEIRDAVRMMAWGAVPVRVDEKYYTQDDVIWTDQSVFRIFGIKLVAGDTTNALTELKSVVISLKTAEKYFGSAENAINKQFVFNYENGYTIRAVMENQPENAHLQMEMLVSYESALSKYSFLKSWDSNSMGVYVLLNPSAKPDEAAKKIYDLLAENKALSTLANSPKIYLQAVSDIHLHAGHIKFQNNYAQGDFSLIIAFVIIALIIIIIACINFINLAIARSVKRAKEVGVRKTLGASRRNLVYQFMGESVIITFLALIAALLLVELSLPEFNQLLDLRLSMQVFDKPLFGVGLLIIWLFVSLLSGIYPAFFISRYQAVEVLKGVRESGSKFGGWLSRALVVFQFSVAIALIFIVIVTNRQIQFVMDKDLGYNYNKVIGVKLRGGDVAQDATLLKQEFKKLSGVGRVAAASNINGVGGSQFTITVDDTADKQLMVRAGYIDADFLPLMDIPIIEGRNFNEAYATDDEAIILNQAAVKALGWTSPIGKKFRSFDASDSLQKPTVIGVISDYHYYSIHSKIEPAAFMLNPDGYAIVCVKYQTEDAKAVIEDLENSWNTLFPGKPFDWISAQERLERQYRNDQNSIRLFTMFTVLALLISALGLYGLSALRVEQRSREIGIRKVLGGSVFQLIYLIIREFLSLIGIAGLIALPVGYIFAQQILDQFAYTVNITVFDGLLSLLAASIIALITLAIHARRAAVSNPVISLKSD
ncbi:MAG: ABC transporter permease [Bacteroidales bacterium]|nr:ABC transporter permease [Bacteroidales bacterium]